MFPVRIVPPLAFCAGMGELKTQHVLKRVFYCLLFLLKIKMFDILVFVFLFASTPVEPQANKPADQLLSQNFALAAYTLDPKLLKENLPRIFIPNAPSLSCGCH